jgi:hypothetical protein
MNDLTIFDEKIEADDPHDTVARDALQSTVLWLANRVRRHGVSLYLGKGILPVHSAASLAVCKPWQLAELLCVLTILDEADSVSTRAVFNLRGKVAVPVVFTRHGQVRYLWIQHTMQGRQSGFAWRPDLVVTDDERAPCTENVIEIIECKHRRRLDSGIIRSEFAKGFDLDTRAYLIWSYYEVPPSVVKGAGGLGLRIRTVGLDGPERGQLLAPEVLARRFAEGMSQARDEAAFAAALSRAAILAEDKLERDRRIM